MKTRNTTTNTQSITSATPDSTPPHVPSLEDLISLRDRTARIIHDLDQTITGMMGHHPNQTGHPSRQPVKGPAATAYGTRDIATVPRATQPAAAALQTVPTPRTASQEMEAIAEFGPSATDLATHSGEPPTDELYSQIEELLRKKPHTFQELIELTGARGNRVSGVIHKLKLRDGIHLMNLGERRFALWFIRPDLTERQPNRAPRARRPSSPPPIPAEDTSTGYSVVRGRHKRG